MQLNDLLISETLPYVYLRRSINMENDQDDELNRRNRTTLVAFGSLKEAADHLANPKLHAHLFDATARFLLKYNRQTQHQALL